MMARLYTGCHDIISLRNAYHGNAAATMSTTGQSVWKFNVVQLQLRSLQIVIPLCLLDATIHILSDDYYEVTLKGLMDCSVILLGILSSLRSYSVIMLHILLC